MAVGDSVGARPGACPMSAAKRRLNLFNFEFNYPFERHTPLWAGTGACPYILCFVLLKSALEISALFFALNFFNFICDENQPNASKTNRRFRPRRPDL
jgi:hypothetical protein